MNPHQHRSHPHHPKHSNWKVHHWFLLALFFILWGGFVGGSYFYGKHHPRGKMEDKVLRQQLAQTQAELAQKDAALKDLQSDYLHQTADLDKATAREMNFKQGLLFDENELWQLQHPSKPAAPPRSKKKHVPAPAVFSPPLNPGKAYKDPYDEFESEARSQNP